MYIFKIKSVIHCQISLCLLIAFAVCSVGCDSLDKEPKTPGKRGDAEVVDMDIKGTDSSSNKADEEVDQESPKPNVSDEGSRSSNPKAVSPDRSSENSKGALESDSGSDEDDSPAPMLNAPKTSSTIPSSESGKPVSSDLASVSSVAVPSKREDDAFLAIRLLSWNVESEGADADVICEQLTELNQNDRYDIVGLTEVEPPDWKKFRSAVGEHYRYEFSRSGYKDRMQILFNTNVFKEIRHFDLEEVNFLNRYRAPLVVQLKHLKTEQEFLVMLNHLARGKAEVRQQQADLLVEWARDQTLPVIAIGDYNFDYVFETQKGNPAFKKMLRDNVWQWVQPEEMIDTNWFDKMGDGEDDYPGSMLDFAFVANAAKNWKKTCRVIVREGDFPDDKSQSDHRPFELEFQ